MRITSKWAQETARAYWRDRAQSERALEAPRSLAELLDQARAEGAAMAATALRQKASEPVLCLPGTEKTVTGAWSLAAVWLDSLAARLRAGSND
jgi:DNA-binding IclR family transcriptional regulator